MNTIFPQIDWNLVLQQLLYNPRQPLIFSSGLFLFLFLAFAFLYLCLYRTATLRIAFVTLFSYYFYYKSSGFYFGLLAVVTVSDWLIGHGLYALQQRGASRLAQRALVVLSLLIDLGLLGYFKYTNFLGELLAPCWGGSFQPYDIFLPVGISFFTFQSLSYTIDIYRGQLQPLRRLLDYAFYVSFFPQLVAGPIVRARDFIPQIHRPVWVSQRMVGQAVFLITAGLIKKAVISDYISLNFVDRVFDSPALYSGLENLLGVYGYTLQIYCDFSGYSDMAIGLALLLGFRFPQNFNAPYKSDSITDFWRRWHISLSSWLRDYLYISLGGNRCARWRMYLNQFLTMLLGGLWHGASLNFVLWGGLHGVALGVHKAYRSARGYDRHYHSTGLKRLGAQWLTFHFVAFCWIFFRQNSFDQACLMLQRIGTAFRADLWPQIWEGYSTVLCVILAGYALHWMPQAVSTRCRHLVMRMPLLLQALLVVAVVYLIIQVKSSDIQPFIYFQF